MYKSLMKRRQAMRDLVFTLMFTLSLLLLLLLGRNSLQAQEIEERANKTSATGAALRTIFSPFAAPEQKTMGLMQMSFLDLTKMLAGRNVELALVIDGTDSMSDEIEGVKSSMVDMVNDVGRQCEKISVAIVVYRDGESPEAAANVLLPKFTSDISEIEEVISQIEPGSGSPYFHEKSDVGVAQAIEKLNWSEGLDTSRWILLVGDAPPYSESFTDTTVPQAKRTYGTKQLIDSAAAKGITIHCLLTQSSSKLNDVYAKAKPETQSFMGALTSGTGGLMLDLSIPEVSQAFLKAGAQQSPSYVEIAAVTKSEIEKARQEVLDSPEDPTLKELRVAILPHMPLQQMTFEPENTAVQISAALRHKFASLPGVLVSSPVEVASEVKRLRRRNLDDKQYLRTLATRLSVDYVVWGDQLKESVMYNAGTGEAATVARFDNSDPNGVQLVSKFLNSAGETQPKLVNLKLSLPPEVQQQVTQRLAKNPLVEREILAALEALQQALGYKPGDPEGDKFLKAALASCNSALESDKKNALVYWLLANTEFNLAESEKANGNIAPAAEHRKQVTRHLNRAIDKENQEFIDSKSLLHEIKVDHTLFGEGNVEKAIKMYEHMGMDAEEMCSSVRRRAHWMLIGIYSGVAVNRIQNAPDAIKQVAAKKAREHTITLLAYWPESPEASLLKKWLQWNPDTGRTEHNFIPFVLSL